MTPSPVASTMDDEAHVARPLILLVTPTDRHGDARRLADAGLRVIATSRAESNLRQIVAAHPTVVAIEWLPGFAADTLAYLAVLMLSAQVYGTTVVVYGQAVDGCDDEVRRLGAQWTEVTPECRDALVNRVRAGVTLVPQPARPVE